MSQSSNVRKTPLKIDAAASDVLVTTSAPILLFLGVGAKPALTDAALTLMQPIRIPKGTGAYVAAQGDHAIVTVSALGVATQPTTFIEQGFTAGGGKEVTAKVGDAVALTSTATAADGAVQRTWYYQRHQGAAVKQLTADAAGAATFNIASAKVTDSGWYTCAMQDAAGSTDRALFKLTVTP